MSQSSETIREDQNATVREGQDANTTVREGPSAAARPATKKTSDFRGYAIRKQLPSKSTEADIYIVEKDSIQYVLKLYRYGIEPKNDILQKMKTLSQAHPQEFIRIFEADYDSQSERWFEIQEYAKYGTLQAVLERSPNMKDGQKINLIKLVAREVGEALALLHQNELLHLDIKPSNILLRSSKWPWDLVLIDFGIATTLSGDMSMKFTQTRGTPMYQAPESWVGSMGRASDWWGLGMILLEIAAGAHPFAGLNQNVIASAIATRPVAIPDNLDERQKELIRGLLTRDPAKRWNWEQVSRWLKGERGIPQFFEASVVEEKKDTPFVFMDQKYNTLSDLLTAFTKDNDTWKKAEKPLQRGDVRKWLEMNGHFDQVEELEKFLERMRGQNSELSSISRSFTVYGKTIVINEDYDKYNTIRKTFQKEAEKAKLKVSSSVSPEQVGENIISDVTQQIAINQILIKNQIYDVDSNQLLLRHYSINSDSYDKAINKWEEKAQIVSEKNKVVNDIYGSLNACEKKISENFVYWGVTDESKKEHDTLMKELKSNKANLEAQLKRTQPSASDWSALKEALYDVVLSLHLRCWNVLEQHGLVSSNNVACCLPGNIVKANAAVNNIPHMDEETILELFSELLLSNPYNPYLYVAVADILGDSNGQLDEVVDYFGITEEFRNNKKKADQVKKEEKEKAERNLPAVRALQQAYLDYQNNPKTITRLAECWKNNKVPDKIREEYKEMIDDFIEEKRKVRNSGGAWGNLIFFLVCFAVLLSSLDEFWKFWAFIFCIPAIIEFFKSLGDSSDAQGYIDTWDESLFNA